MSSQSAWTGASPHIDKSELMCKIGCGFYGNPAWDGYCSKCFKEQSHKRQRRPVFDPTNIKNKVSRSVSDVSELQSKATSIVSRNLDRLDEKRRQQLGKRTKAVKEIFRKSQQPKSGTSLPPQLSTESHLVTEDLRVFLKTLPSDAQLHLNKQINAFVDKIQKTGELLSIDRLADQFHDFYSSLGDLVNTHPALSAVSDEQINQLNNITERYITTRLYKILSSVVNADCEEKDLAIQERIRSLMWVSCYHLECKIDETNKHIESLVDEIITDLIEMDSKRTPGEKLSLLVKASHEIMNVLKLSGDGAPASADDFLPALIYSVLRANPPLLQSNIAFITNYAQEMSLQSGETGYFFTNLCCAVSFIEKLTADSLSLTDAEFDHYMSGDALPMSALDADYMCEGLRLMQQNLDGMESLDHKMDHMMNGHADILQQFDTFKEKMCEDIEVVLQRTPLDIRNKTATIDEPDPTQELLPPPLLPQAVAAIRAGGSAQTETESWRTSNPFAEDIFVPPQNGAVFPNYTRDSSDSLWGPPKSLDSVYFPSNSTSCNQPQPADLPVPRKPTSLPFNPYSGFTLQGERIQSIACDTGSERFSPQDPFSPLQGSTHSLPPPLIPSASYTNPPRRRDTMDKVANVFGELVSSFDKLL